VDSQPVCCTFELPWKGNKRNISCIPKGIYDGKYFNSNTFGDAWRINNVYGRSNILIHIGNWLGDTKGCILIGMGFSGIGVIDSKDAITRLKGLVDGDFTLEVVEV
jgi:hypothetical protein